MPNEMLRIDTPWLQESMQYELKRKTTAPYAKHWDSFNIYPLDPIFPQQPLGSCSTL